MAGRALRRGAWEQGRIPGSLEAAGQAVARVVRWVWVLVRCALIGQFVLARAGLGARRLHLLNNG